MSLLPVAEAQARLLARAAPLAGEVAPLDQCIGRWLATDVIAGRDQPWADLSAMDGYAIRHADLPGPWAVSGESAAGGPLAPSLKPGQATRIFTGAPVPDGADSVVIQEDTERAGDALSLKADMTVRLHAHIRARGSDFARGAVLLSRGTRLAAPQLALAALGGHGMLHVGRRPKIALLSTGSELVTPGADTAPEKLPASNAIMLRAMLASLPCDIEDIGIVHDSLPALTAAFRRASSADIVVSTGGASVGDHDLVRPALEAAGGTLDFWKIALRPGKPLIAGELGAAALLGLPGNPVSAFVTATLFLLPLVRHLSGSQSPLPDMAQAALDHALRPGGQRDEYLRAVRNGDRVSPLDDQDSAGMVALARANCFILRPAGTPARERGDLVSILPILSS